MDFHSSLKSPPDDRIESSFFRVDLTAATSLIWLGTATRNFSLTCLHAILTFLWSEIFVQY